MGILIVVFLLLAGVLLYVDRKICKEYRLGCGRYIERAKTATSAKSMRKDLYCALDYLYEAGMTEGNTSLFLYSSTNDLGLWYEELYGIHASLKGMDAKRGQDDFDEIQRELKDCCPPDLVNRYPHQKKLVLAAVGLVVLFVLAIAVYAAIKT